MYTPTVLISNPPPFRSSHASPGRFRTSTLIPPEVPPQFLSSRSVDGPTVVLGGSDDVPIKPTHERPAKERPVYKMQKQRTSAFSIFKKKNRDYMERGEEGDLNKFTNMAIVRVHSGGATSRWTEEARLKKCPELDEMRGELRMNVSGGMLSEYSRKNLYPLILTLVED